MSCNAKKDPNGTLSNQDRENFRRERTERERLVHIRSVLTDDAIQY